ncbi:integrator complex subunit 3 isoform X3 [Mycetomoellerius zeteki]|nr:PREDICTED: integrator complex subunit 3 isoform X3 [Trachymyrmex zeteki]
MAGAHLLHDDYVHSRKDSDDEAFNLKIINQLVNTLSRELSLESYWKIRNTVNATMSAQETEVENLKQQGNACVREKKYQKAMLHYSQAIKLDPKNYSLYSNRSFTFLMLERYRDALNDALMTIRLKPDWSKGYFRKGEVELKLCSYNEALESYNKALSLQPNEPKILEAMNKASKSLIKDRRADQQIPWLGAGVGIILGVTVVIADYVFTNKPTLTHPLLMALLTMTIAMIGFAIAKGLRYFLKHQRKSVLIGDFPHCLVEANELDDIYVKESTDTKKKERGTGLRAEGSTGPRVTFTGRPRRSQRAMEQPKTPASRLFNTTCIENKDDLEEKLERCHSTLQNLITGLSEKEAHDTLNNAVCKDKAYEEVSLGLLVIILTEPQNAAKSYRDLTLITRDGLGIVLLHLNQLVLDKYLRLNDVTRSQLLWLLREMIRTSVTNVDNLCLTLLRHAAGGDISPKNLFLVDALLDIFQENRPWLDKFSFLVASIVYTYLRLIEDHNAPHLAGLRQKEVTFTTSLIRERMADCLAIGRDLVRLLQNVARIPEFEALWKDILLNPKSLCPNFNGVLQLLQTRTSRRFLQSRLTPEMERKLVFLTSNVRFGNHKRYQDWFQRQYLATPESQSLRCDLIRFIVGVIHPTNELLCSDIIPRWAVIGWLFTTCTSTVAASNAKLALFYDWLFFDPDKDNIMNIEPAILVMHNSMRSHPPVTATLLDFLCRIIPNFYPALTEKVRNGIFSSLRQILEKRVLPSLYPLFDSPKLDRELRSKIRETFKEFCLPPNSDMPGKMEELNKEHNPGTVIENTTNSTVENNHVAQDPEPAFSDEEEESPLRIVTKVEEEEDEEDVPLSTVKLKNDQKNANCVVKKEDITSHLRLILEPEELRTSIETLHTETDNESRCQAMERIVQMVVEDEIDAETIPALASCISTILSPQITAQIFPSDNLNEEVLADSISTPLFVMFRNQFQLCKEEDNRRKLLARVLAEMQSVQSKTGYLLLYFLKVWGREEEKREGEPSNVLNDVKASVYKDFCAQREKKLDVCLVSDLKLCHEDNIFMLCYLVPDVYTGFQNVAVGNVQLLHLVVSTVDSCQLQDLVCQIMQGHLKMLKKESFTTLLTASLNWETFEQYCFWQLIFAHDFPIDYVLPVLPKLQFRNHAEALTSILFMLKQEKPTLDLLRQLLARQSVDGDMFVVAALRYWCRDYEEKLGELLANLLSTRYPATSPNKRKRSGAKQNQQSAGPPTGEQVLGHLDQLRQHCMSSAELQLYHSEGMQRALQQAQAASSDSLRKSYGDLFALAEVNEENEPPPPSSSARKHTTASSGGGGASGKGGHRKTGANTRERSNLKRPLPRYHIDSTSSSEEEEIVNPKQAKKRKKINPVGSDSD